MVELLWFEILLLEFVLFRPDFDLSIVDFFICLKGIVVIRIHDLFSWAFFDLFEDLFWLFLRHLGKRVGQIMSINFLGFKGQFVNFLGEGRPRISIKGEMFKLLCTYTCKMKFLKRLGAQPHSVPTCVCSLGF